MPSDGSKSNEQTRRQQSQQQTTWHGLRIPPAVKQLFDQFPLYQYDANKLPLRTPAIGRLPVLHIFTTYDDARTGAPSFNPSCAKWQAFLKFNHIDFITAPSNNHASPSGSLPYLFVAELRSNPVTTSRFTQWVESRTKAVESLDISDAQRPLEALAAHSIRLAYLFALYVDRDTFDAVTSPLYIEASSSSWLAQSLLSYPLRRAAYEEIMTCGHPDGVEGGLIDWDELMASAEEALEALSVMLGSREWFEADNDVVSSKPRMLDASVFAYTHVILRLLGQPGAGKPAQQLMEAVQKRGNLVQHRDRILAQYFT